MKKKIDVVLTQYSQPHVLKHRMNEADLKHGDTVTANISPVRIESVFGKMVMYFCPTQNINILNKLETGDGLPLPEEATIKNITVPDDIKPGLYNIINATLHSNGTMQVIANENTFFEEYNEADEFKKRFPAHIPDAPKNTGILSRFTERTFLSFLH